jgi:hypothetical protein
MPGLSPASIRVSCVRESLMPLIRWAAAATVSQCLAAILAAAPPVSGPALGRSPGLSEPGFPPAPSQQPSLAAPPPAPAEAGFPSPPELAALQSSAVWSDILTAIAREALPDKFEDRSHWGKTKEIFAGVDVEPNGNRLLPRISKREIEVRHGFWRKHRVDLINPERTFQIAIDNIRPGAAGVTEFDAKVTLRARITANVEHWVRGVKGFNMEIVSDATVVMHAACCLACRSERPAGSALPELVLEPDVQAIKLRLADLHVEKFGELRGDLAEELGNGSRGFVEDLLQRREDELVAKARREIDKRRDDLRLSPADLVGE